MQPCNRMYYSKIYWRLNMFRASCHSSSGAPNCICSLWFIYRNKVKDFVLLFFLLWRCDPTPVMASSFLRFLDHTRHTTAGRTPLDEWSARRRDLYLTTHNNHNRQTSMPPRWDSNPRSQQARGRRPTSLDREAIGTSITIVLLL